MNLKKYFIEDAFAHCDIPCGIYDPHAMQVAAHTVIRMTQLLEQAGANEKLDNLTSAHDISRMVHVKEEHGQIIEEELDTFQNDYFKSEHFERFPDLKNLFEQGVKFSITCRQHIDLESAKNLLETTIKIAEIFYQSKGLEFARVKSPFPTELDIVVQK